MKKLFSVLLAVLLSAGVSAQDNMEGFRHLSVGAEAGLHGFGVELAMPVQKHFVFKAGCNLSPSDGLLGTDISIDTKNLADAQRHLENTYHQTFTNRFKDKSTVSAGLEFGLFNFKAMLNVYPFRNSRFYLAGGAYYSVPGYGDESLVAVCGKTSKEDWDALKELNEKAAGVGISETYAMELELGGRKYTITEKDGRGSIRADFKVDPLKYYVGAGLGRCIPNGPLGFQFEVGAMIYQNSVLTCQGEEIRSLGDALNGELSGDVKEIIDYADKYPVYPQVTLRLSFRLF